MPIAQTIFLFYSFQFAELGEAKDVSQSTVEFDERLWYTAEESLQEQNYAFCERLKT